MSGSTYAAAAAAVRGRRAAGRAGGRAARGGRLPAGARHGPGRRARARAHRVRCWTDWPTLPGCGSSGRPTHDGPGRRGVVRRRRRPPARRRPGAGRPGHRGPGGPPLRAAAAPPVRRARPRRGPRSTCTTTTDEVTRSVDGLRAGAQGSSGRRREHGPLPGDHPRPLPSTRTGEGLRDPFDAEVHHVNPTCGDEVTLRVRLGHRRERPWTTCRTTRQGCAISQAVRPRCCTDLVIGRPLDEVARHPRGHARRCSPAAAQRPGTRSVLGDGVALAGRRASTPRA